MGVHWPIFSLKTLFVHKELIPLTCFLVAVPSYGLWYCYYSLKTKPDVLVDKRRHSMPWDRIDPNQPQKFFRISQRYEAIPEKTKLYKDIGSYEA